MGNRDVPLEVRNNEGPVLARPDMQVTSADQRIFTGRGRGAVPELPPLSIDAHNYAQSYFDLMDGNSDGFVSKKELDGYAKANTGQLSEKERKIVDELKEKHGRLQTASNDETGFENDGFTRQDLKLVKTDSTASTTAAPADYELNGSDMRPALAYANENFGKMDADKNGFISKEEIGTYMADNELTASENRMLRNLRDHSAQVQTMNKDGDNLREMKGISQKDLSAANDEVNTLVFAAENFTALDGDGNGHVTKEEVTGYERARQNLTGDDMKALDALRSKVDKLDDAHNDEMGDENDGFTGHDLLAAMDQLGSANARGQRKLDAPTVTTEVATTPPPVAATAPEVVTPPGTPPEAGTPPGGTDAATQERTHTVSSGDTLWRICADELRSRNGGSRPSNNDVLSAIRAVENANPNLDRDRIKPGQEIKLPVDLSGPTIAEGEPNQNGRNRPIPRPTPLPRDPGESRLPPNERPNPPREPGEAIPPGAEAARPEPEKSDPDVLRDNWRNIDRSGDNRVSREEIQDFVRNNQRNLTMKEISALGRMAAREGKIQELVNDERGDENSGMSMADVRKAEQMQAAAQYLLRRDVMDNLNVNGDRFVDKRELEYALRTQNMRPQDRAMLNYLRSNYAKFQEGANNERGDENSGVSIQDLQYYAGLV